MAEHVGAGMMALGLVLAAPVAAAQDAGKPSPDRTEIPQPVRLERPTPPPIRTVPTLPPPSIAGRGPVPSNSPGSWIAPADYPARALREGAEGVVRVRLTVGADGRVAQCVVTMSSGFASLDDGACRALERRARFDPALDRDGNRVEGSYTQNVRWEIPLPLAPQPFGVAILATIDEEGFAIDCVVEEQSGDLGPGQLEETPCEAGVRYQPYRDEDGNPVARRVRFRTSVEFAD